MRVILLLCLCLPLLAQNRVYKDFDIEGQKLLKEGSYAEAAKSFSEALRLESKPQKYKLEGTYFNEYMPRYRLALCYEHLNLLEAEEWFDKSKEALESEVVAKIKQKLADYHADYARIHEAAGKQRELKKNEYDLALNDARNLLENNRFKEAKAAFEALYKQDPSRTEAQVALESLGGKKSNYLDKLSLTGQTAIIGKDWRKVEDALQQMAQVDPGDARIATLRSQLAEAQKPVAVAVNTVPVDKPVPPPVRETRTKPEQLPVVQADRPPVKTADPKKELKASVKATLLASLDPYRQRGDAAKALEKLETIPAQDGATFASYHWLKAVYQLTIYQQEPQKDEQLKARANASLAEVAELLPNFKPDPALFPDYIIAAYTQASQNK